MRSAASGLVVVLIASLVAGTAGAENCPPNAFHCQLVIEVGQTVTVVVQMGMEVVATAGDTAAIFAANPGASARIWANVYVDASAGGAATATVSIEFDESAGVTFPQGAEDDVAATATPQNLTFPIEIDDDFAEGDVAFVPVTVLHEDGTSASTHIPVQVGSVAERGLWDWWWLFALVLLVGALIGALLARVF